MDDFVSLHGADGQINDPEYEQNRCVYPLGGRGSAQLGSDVRIYASVHHNEYGDHCLATEKRHSKANPKGSERYLKIYMEHRIITRLTCPAPH